MAKFWKASNLLILLVLFSITIIGSFYKGIFIGSDKVINLSYLILYISFFAHIVLTVISSKKGGKRHMILTVVFLLLTLHIYLKSTLWRCSEYSFDSNFFYLPCRFEKNPCSLSRETLLDIQELDSIIQVPEIKQRDRDWMSNNYDEPSILDSKQETYRFIWSSSFEGSEIVRIKKKEDSYYVTKKIFSSHEDSIGVTNTFLIEEEIWDNVVDSLNILGFWTYKRSIDRLGLDGAGWILEGYKPRKDKCTKKNYHRVGRWSPIDTTFITMSKLVWDLKE